MGEGQQQRIHPRIDIESIVAYMLVDHSRNFLGQGVGKILNLSQGGVMVQTHESIDAPYMLLSLICGGNQELTILGQVVYCRPERGRWFNVGVKFLENDEKKKLVITNLVKSYSRQKHS